MVKSGEEPAIEARQDGHGDGEALVLERRQEVHGDGEPRRIDRRGKVVSYLCDARHVACQLSLPSATAEAEPPGIVSRWRMNDRMKTGYVAVALCLNIGVDPPDVIKLSPCARLECWIDPFSAAPPKALDAIGRNLQAQYERWQPRADYKVCLDPTLDEVKKLCLLCRKNAKHERVLFHYNGHGVPKPTKNGEIWLFNKHFTQYLPLSVYELESFLGHPSIYLFDCSAAGMIVNAFCERPDWASGGHTSASSVPALRDCILLAACGAYETLPQNSELPADVFTSCLTTPIKIALRWFCSRSLLCLDPDLFDKIPGRQNDRKTPLGELNWIFTAITDTIAWNVLPRELFQRLFRQDLLVASLFRNFLLAERIMKDANCCPQSYPRLPSTHQHSMWHAWDMAAELCLTQIPILLSDPAAEFESTSFFTEQLTAFEVWLDHGSEWKKPPEQLPIVLQVLLSQSHRSRALLLLGRFLDMGAWAVDLALSVGIFPYVLKLLQTTAIELQHILVFIWTKILAQDKSCQVDLVKDGGHWYFIRFLEKPDILPEQHSMAAFVLAVIADGHPRGQQAYIQANLTGLCLSHLQHAVDVIDKQSEPLLLQWLCLCLGKHWEGSPVGASKAFNDNATAILGRVLAEPQPEVRAAAIFALGRLVKVSSKPFPKERRHDDLDEATRIREQEISHSLLNVLGDGSPLVRAELATAMGRLASGHNRRFREAVEAYMRPASSSSPLPPIWASPLLEREVLKESVGNDEFTNTDSTSRNRSEDENIYVQCVIAVHALARDPSPSVAFLGQQVLRIMGVELAQTGMPSRSGANGVAIHHQTSSAPSSPIADVLHRVTSTAGNIANAWRVSTPPPSPPNRQPFLAGAPNSLRRVASMEAPWNTPTLPGRTAEEVVELASSSQVPSSGNGNIAHGKILASGLSTVNPGSPAAFFPLPESTFYRRSCEHFSRPLLEPFHDDDEENIARREIREREACNGIAMWQHSSVSKLGDQIASWDTGSAIGIKAVLLHPFKPLVCTADDIETIRVWDYEEATVMNTFENHMGLDKGVSKLCLLNETDDSLLLVASNDGSVRIWKDYTQRDNHCLATAWQTSQGSKPGSRSTSAAVDWQQMTGFLYSSGPISDIMVWDLEREQLSSTISTRSESFVSAMASCQTDGAHLITGHGDGSVLVYDIRSPETLVCSMKPHAQKVVGLDFLPGMEFSKIVSASAGGDLRFLDLRQTSAPFLEVAAHRGHLTSLTAHRHAPVIATGSGKQLIKVFSTDGKQLNMVKFHNSFLGQRIGPVSALGFHPYEALLAAGAMDSIVSIYAGDLQAT